MAHNIVLTGLMGTGKSSVAHKVSQLLDRPLVNMDAEIEKRAGKPIPRIFAEDGEGSFRQLEAELGRELSQQMGLIIDTGGGALVNPASRKLLMNSSTVLCLTCSAGEILQRVAGSDRPLLQVADPHAEIERLLVQRAEAYAAIPWQIDTTGRTIEDVAREVIALIEINTLTVEHPGGRYPIHIGLGLLDRVGDILRAAGVPAGGRVALVSNSVVAPLYAEQVENSLRAAGLDPFQCTIPDGEQHKTLDSVTSLYDQFLAGRLDRSGTVLALGGGVTGDIAGFAAASFMRGVRFAQIPTTVLSMADASVGGKTGVDLPQGKNLAGAFKQPAVVIIDPEVLVTLPAEEYRSGMAEVIKHGVISDPQLFTVLQSGPINPLTPQLLAQTVQVKIEVVEEDPYERGRRAVLNLGHTVGHGLEKLSQFQLRHGEAVAIGMTAAVRIAAELEWCNRSLAQRIEASLAAWSLPTRCPPFRVDDIWAAMTHDKKRQGYGLRWVLPREIGRVQINDEVPAAVVRSVLLNMGATKT